LGLEKSLRKFIPCIPVEHGCLYDARPVLNEGRGTKESGRRIGDLDVRVWYGMVDEDYFYYLSVLLVCARVDEAAYTHSLEGWQ
jgi:hypothetical protein